MTIMCTTLSDAQAWVLVVAMISIAVVLILIIGRWYSFKELRLRLEFDLASRPRCAGKESK